MFLADDEHYASDGLQRRLDLTLVLHLADVLTGSEVQFDTTTFRGMMYSGHLPSGEAWKLPSSLEVIRQHWKTYQTNELLSLAFLSMFASVLDLLEDRQASNDAAFPTIESLAEHFVDEAFGDAVETLCGTTQLGEYLKHLPRTAPPIADWMHDDHEHQICERLLRSSRHEQTIEKTVFKAFWLICLLAMRMDEAFRPAYEGLLLTEEDLFNYPINLESFRLRLATWRASSIRLALKDIALWCLSTHLSVAIRKLRATGQATFRFRLGDRGVEIVESPPVTRTTPRFNQTLQILIDLGAIHPDGSDRHHAISVTKIGREWMSRYAN